MRRSAITFMLSLVIGSAAYAQTIPVQPINPSRLTPDQARETQATISTPTSNVEDVYEQRFTPQQPAGMNASFIDRVAQTWRPTQDFSLKPKDNIMIAVGQGLMNTISTNLTMLTAKTNDESSTFEIDQGYLYVTVSSLNPISLVLYEEGVLESQVSITLVPVPAPPTIAKLAFEITPAMKAKSEAFQKKMKLEDEQLAGTEGFTPKHDAHTTRVIDILTPVAQGDIPRGFGLTPDIPEPFRHPCQMSIYHRTEQRLVSGNDIIDVVLVINDSDRPYNIREEMCLSNGTLAVALFEKSYLLPSDSSEVYILRDKRQELEQKRRQRRPRLTDGVN